MTTFEEFLRTDPRDVGCGEAMDVLHVYVEVLAAGDDAAVRFPGVAVHLQQCGPCSQDFQDLLALVTE